jgi:hypothetical protein
MKKVMLTVAGLLFVSVLAVQAQEDTTVLQRDTTVQPQTQPQTEPQQEEGSTFLRDMAKVQATEIPAPLRQTLQAPEYKGWDASTSTIYRSQNSDLYIVEIFDGTMTKTYRFDKNGKALKNDEPKN